MDNDVVNLAPRHLWIVGFASLMWNGFGAWDHVMTSVREPGYVGQFPPEAMQVIDAFPIWVLAVWAIGVWAAVGGSLLLLWRSRLAVHAFALSLAGLAASQAYRAGLDLPASLTTPAMTAMSVLIWIVAVGLVVYAWRMVRAGALR